MKKPILLSIAEYSLALMFLGAFRSLPRKAARNLGRFIGWAGWYLFLSSKKTALINLDIVYGSTIDEKEKKRIAYEAFLNMGETIYEFIMFPKFSKQYFEQRTTVKFSEAMIKRVEEGNGVIVMSAHYSNWEWIAGYFGLQGIKVNAVVRPLDNPYLDNFIERERAAKGVKVLPRKLAVRQGLDAIRNGEVLALMIDQNQAVNGTFVPYFGTLASTMRGPVFYYTKTNAPVFFAIDRRDKSGNHEIIFSEEFKMTGDEVKDLTAINSWLEKKVLEKPELNFWVHPRWNKRPPGEESIYKNRIK